MFPFRKHVCRTAGCRCVRLTLVALAALGAAFALAPIPDVQAVKPGLNGKIAFDSDRNSNVDIYTMDNDGSAVTRLTSSTAADQNPSWSPDPTSSSRIAFESTRNGTDFEIYTMRADHSTNPVNITNNSASDTGAAWSPLETKIAFTTNRDGNSEIYTMNADGTGQLNITINPASDVQAAWSPDGTKIAFVSDRDGNLEIYTMNADGTSPTQLTATATPTINQSPTWSPDGTKIVFVSDRDGVGNEIYSMNVADPSSQTRLTTNTSNDREVVWTPNGNKLALSSRAAGGNFEIYGANSDGSGTPTNLTNNAATDSNPDVQTEQAPDTTITLGPASPTNSTSATFDFISSEAGSTFSCKLDSSIASCTSPKTYTGLSAGPHTVEVTAIDGASIPDPTPATYTWTIDTAPPDTSITSQPSNLTTSPSASFSFTSSEFGSTFECKLDSGSYASCSDPNNYAGLSDGSHTFYVRATDGAANTDLTPASYTWTIDTTAPQTTITAGPAHVSTTQQANFEFTSTESGAIFLCRLNQGSWETCTSPQTVNVGTDGGFVYEVSAVDQAGNPDPTPASYSWTVDSGTPETDIDSGPPGHSRSVSATFGFHASESDVAFECSLDGEEFAPCSSPEPVSALVPGRHTFQVRATDSAGNVDQSPAGYTWTVDRRMPQVKASLGNGSAKSRDNKYRTFKRSNLKELTGTASDESGLRRVKVVLRIDGKAAAAQDSCRFISLYTGHRIAHPCKKPYTNVTGTTDWRLRLRNRVVNRLRTDEQYVLMVRATDVAGNNKYTRTRFAVVDG